MSNKDEAVTYAFQQAAPTCFVNIIEPNQYKKNGKPVGKPRYGATFLLDKESPDLIALKASVSDMAKKLWPGKKVVARRLTQEELDAGNVVEISVPWQDGTKFADKSKVPDANGKTYDNEFARGKVLVKAASDYMTAISILENGKVVEINDLAVRATKTTHFYSGAFLAPYVQLHSYQPSNEKPGGVSLWLQAACFIKHGPKTSAGQGTSVNAVEVFKGYAGQSSQVDPTGGVEEEEF